MTWCEVSTLSVPRLICFSGVVKGPEVKPSTTLGITFFLYKEEQGGAPLWMETQKHEHKRSAYGSEAGAAKGHRG